MTDVTTSLPGTLCRHARHPRRAGQPHRGHRPSDGAPYLPLIDGGLR